MNLKKLSILAAILLAMSLVLAACGGSDAGNSLERVEEEGTFTVVGSGGYPPFNFIDDNGDVVGFDVDTGAEIADRLGVELDYVTSDWDGLTEGLRAGRYDGILGSMAITDERLEIINFSIPYYYSGAQLIVHQESGITDPSEMDGKTIAVVTGTNFVRDAEELGAEVVLYQDDNATLMELISGRVDGVITDRLVGLEAMSKLSGGDELVLTGDILRLEQMAIAFNQDDTELMDKVNEILEEMHADGTLQAISERWHDGADITVQ